MDVDIQKAGCETLEQYNEEKKQALESLKTASLNLSRLYLQAVDPEEGQIAANEFWPSVDELYQVLTRIKQQVTSEE